MKHLDKQTIKLKKKKKRTRVLLEFNRSLSLFFIITKMLAMVALLMVISSTDEPFYKLLMITEEQAQNFYNIEKVPSSVLHVILSIGIYVCSVGLYGYASSNRYIICFYTFSLVFVMLFMQYAVLVAFLRGDTDRAKQDLFLNYEKNENVRKAAHFIQQTFHCCGSSDFRYSGWGDRPQSCCPLVEMEPVPHPFTMELVKRFRRCYPDEAFNQTCRIKIENTYTALKEANALVYLIVLCLPLTLISGCQIFFGFCMVYHLTKLEKPQLPDSTSFEM